jgi:OOP family OmpA-OmpF porin
MKSFRLLGRLIPASVLILACQFSVSSRLGGEEPAQPTAETTAPQTGEPAPSATDPGATTSPDPQATTEGTTDPATTTDAVPTTLPTELPTTLPTEIPTTLPPTEPVASNVRTEGDKILLPGNIVFATGQTILSPTPENQAVLAQLKQFLIDNPKVTTLRIEGYTDNVGQPESNLKLSGERALAIKKWLVYNGISEERVIAVGFGQDKPVADNSTAEGRAQNRRTEFKIAAVNGRPYRGVAINGGGTEFK